MSKSRSATSHKKKTCIKSHLVDLNEYEVVDEISRGGFGIVFLIKSKADNHHLAAKVNVLQDKTTLEESKELSREIGILMQVSSPTIIRFWGFSLKDFQGYSNITILMDYCENGSLRQLIEQKKKTQSPLQYDDTAKQIILCGIAHGMMTLHSRRVLHRDLKPDNVLLDINFRPYITDFGLSKFLDPTNSKSQSQSGCGTASYMSPEVINDIHYSTKSDVYSFGILMFEVLTGEFAFSELFETKNFNPFQIIMRVVNGERPTFKKSIKASFEKLIKRCWSQDPRDRPTFRELFHKLSLSHEDDDETIESSLQDIISHDEEADEFKYLLDNADVNQLLEYVHAITQDREKNKKELFGEEQTKCIYSIEDQHQREIDELRSENQRKQQEIELLKSKLNELTSHTDQGFTTTESKSSDPNYKSPVAHGTTIKCINLLEGLTISEMKERIQKKSLPKLQFHHQ